MKLHGYLINGNFSYENDSDSDLNIVIPLYTYEPESAKQLSDEEIRAIINAVGLNTDGLEDEDFDNARAIIKEITE